MLLFVIFADNSKGKPNFLNITLVSRISCYVMVRRSHNEQKLVKKVLCMEVDDHEITGRPKMKWIDSGKEAIVKKAVSKITCCTNPKKLIEKERRSGLCYEMPIIQLS